VFFGTTLQKLDSAFVPTQFLFVIHGLFDDRRDFHVQFTDALVQISNREGQHAAQRRNGPVKDPCYDLLKLDSFHSQ